MKFSSKMIILSLRCNYYSYYANFTTRQQLEQLSSKSTVGKAKHGWEWVLPSSPSDSQPYWRSCDVGVKGHHSELSTGWISTLSSPGETIKPKLRLEYTTWCENRRDPESNCNGRYLKLKIETKQSVNDEPIMIDYEIRISQRHQMEKEEDYFRPQTSELPSLEGSFFQITIYDDDLCLKVGSIQIFAYVCKEEVVDLALFRKTIAPFERTNIDVLGECVQNAQDEQVRAGSLTSGSSRVCTSFGSWQDTFSLCKCLPGFEPNEEFTQCNACPVDHYKSTYDNSPCVQCPLNSVSEGGQAECGCRSNFHKEDNVPPSVGCATTPSEPRDLKAQSIGSSFARLSWQRPWADGGRSDLKYTIHCQECYPPREYTTVKTNFTIANLMPNTQYTFRVFALNSVSPYFHDISFKELMIETTEEVFPTNLRILASLTDSNSIALSWDPPSDFSGQSYCVEMNSVGNPRQSVMTHCVNGTKFFRSGIEEGHYTFRVAAQYPDGTKGSFSPSVSGQVTGHLQIAKLDMKQLVAVMAIVATISVLILILCLGMACLYRKHHVGASFMEQQSHFVQCNSLSPNAQINYPYGTLSGKIPIGQAFVEPNFYGEPELMFAEFVKEIPENWIAVESQIAALGDESLWCGKFCVPNQQPVDVSLKTITHEFSAAGGFSQHKIAVEASTMAQFNHPHVLLLHGMVFSPTEWTMVTECPQRVTLEKVLQTPTSNFSPLHVVHILRGISAGMRYLSDMGYVHKVLTSRTVYMGDHLVFKIGGFDLRALLEEENTTNSKAPLVSSEIHNFLIPWYAPEVIQSRKYSSASDVWAFGVLVWQALSFGDLPFGSCPAEEIAELVSKGQKLSAPKGCPQILSTLIADCWKFSRGTRPPFSLIQTTLENIIRQPYSIDYQHNSNSSANSANDETPHSENGDSSIKLKTFEHVGTIARTPNSSVSICDFLKKIGLSQYDDLFKRHGYLYVHEVQAIDEENLVQIGLNNQKHQKKILASLNPNFSPKHTIDSSNYTQNYSVA
ncbi:ephrin type-B receptor 1-B-like isoform X2 [Symsagittifera roscoffensis]|uniref:ephrin type-B receptor 1-B-like isoform X2 n=1 Tax=Symsagittifera roscoffensis TaxID=84072 RepID=UPI00307B99E4